MMYVAAITVVFLTASVAMISKLGAYSSATLEKQVAEAQATEVAPTKNVYMHQFEEAVASYR